MGLATRELSIDDPAYLQFVERCQGALAFHHPGWAKVLAESYGYRALALAVMGPFGEIVGGLPALELRRPFGARRYVSLPFTDYCPPLASADDATQVARALVAAASNDMRLDVRGALPGADGVHTAIFGVRHTLLLDSDFEMRIGKHHRRNLRRAERSDLHVRSGTSIADMATFYRLHRLTRQRQGVPVQPWRFFERLAQLLDREKLGFVLSVYLSDVPVAAAVFMTLGRSMIYKYGASDPSYWELRPNYLLFRHAIRRGVERGLGVLDWGRTDLDNKGLRDFKSGWGAVEEPLVYSVIARRPPAPPSAHIDRALAPVIRHSPSWVGQAIGEVLYRYAA